MTKVQPCNTTMEYFEQYQADRRIWRAFYRHSRTFSLAARLLPRRVQVPIATVYLFCRRVDTLADQRVLEVGSEQALSELETLRYHLARTLNGHPPDDDLLWQRLAEVHDAFPLARQPMEKLIQGAAWDLEGRTVRDMHDFIDYAHLVGGSIGGLMLPFLTSEEETRRLDVPARRLGIAMQITNIVRDVGEDLHELRRLYLPHTWMQRAGLSQQNLIDVACGSGSIPPAYPQLMEFVMNIAETHYASTLEAISDLPRRAGLAIQAAARMYREILNEVRANGYDNLSRRAYVTLPRKLRLLAQDDYERRKEELRSQAAFVTAAPRLA